MHDDGRKVRERVRRLLRERIEPAERRRTIPASVSAWEVPGDVAAFPDAVAAPHVPMEQGAAWGRPWGTTWLRVTSTVPADAVESARSRWELVLDLGFSHHRPGFQAEGLVFTAGGEVVKAVEPRNRAVPVPQEPGAAVELYVEAASNPDMTGDWTFVPTPLGHRATAPDAPLYRRGEMALVLRDLEVSELIADVRVLLQLLDHLPADRPRAARITRALRALISVLAFREVHEAVVDARDTLRDVLASPAAASAHRVLATGHAHIDSAWLWPTRETVRKCARTFSNVLNLMDEHDDFVFACSSAQQFVWIREHYPELFARIQSRVAEGRFIPVGGMWVEADTNMPSGESLVRQFVEGGAEFRAMFGVDAPEAWLPDSFGYSGALPQIAAAAGARWLLTQKMSWNDTNTMPHHTFWWEGIDGTRVFTHFPPADTYVSDVSLDDLDRAERQFADKEGSSLSLLPFGYGNGGGGPTREMIAAARRTADLEGSPRVEIADPREFFRRAEEEYATDAPVWNGEMYLELHRGVFTSQSRTKRGNRRCEQALHDAELWATTAMVRCGAPYPRDELQRLWRLVLLQQFHDVLPGSSIAWVHEDAERAHAEVEASAARITAEALAVLTGEGDREMWVNSAPVERDGALGMSVSATAFDAAPVTPQPRDDGGWTLDNDHVRAVIDADGLVSSLVDAATGRDVIPEGRRGCIPELFADTPTEWDAWDVDLLDRTSGRALLQSDTVRVVADVVEVSRSFGSSRLVQRYSLRRGARALDLDVDVDWHERDRTLKLSIPVDVHADRFAAQTQFGQITRSLHTNTSWDAARFEVCAHRYIAVEEPGFGVAVVNTGTYGHDVSRLRSATGDATLLRPTLLRGPRYPDPEADRGRHTFGFSIVVGGTADAVRESYARNSAPVRTTGSRTVSPLVAVTGSGVVVDTVKAARDGTGDVVVRLYESLGASVTATLHPDFPFETAVLTDLHERPTGDQLLPSHGVRIDFAPFRLVTVRLARKKDVTS